MKIIISNNRSKPIYEQIAEQIRDMIINGQLQAGEKIMSIRELAKSLRVSIITVKRAYEELQAEGFIETSVGKGSYIADDNLDFIKERQLKDIEDLLKEAVDKAKEISLDESQLIDLIKILFS